jgi:hypothetical protein
MSRADHGGGRSRPDENEDDRRAVSAFLRGLAARAERDPDFARHVRSALQESGLLADELGERSGVHRAAGQGTAGQTGRTGRIEGAQETEQRAPSARRRHTSAADAAPALPDPFVVLRVHGEQALRATLDGLDLASLRRIVRAHHLDPHRVSARWSARERVIGLIVEQVRARAQHGKAFERV